MVPHAKCLLMCKALHPVNIYWPKKPGHVSDTCQTTYSDVEVHGAKMRPVLQHTGMSNDQICSQQTVTFAKMSPNEVCGKKCGWEHATWPSSHTWFHENFQIRAPTCKNKSEVLTKPQGVYSLQMHHQGGLSAGCSSDAF